jgi:protein TonB
MRSLAASRSPVRERLTTMLFLTALLHAIVILGITFTSPSRGKTSPGLEVLLVTDDLPEIHSNEQAAYIAQRSQRGTGNTRDLPTSTPSAQRARSESTTAGTLTGEAVTLTTSGHSLLVRYLGTLNTGAAARNQRAVSATERAGRGDGTELVLRGDPRTGQWLSPDTRASRLAPYLDAWRRKVERLGTLNYPTVARDAGLSGSPVIEVAIRADGRLQESRVQRTSGHAALDQAALNILRLASPFNPFPPELAADYRVLRFAYQWEFVAGRPTAGSVTAGTDAVDGP